MKKLETKGAENSSKRTFNRVAREAAIIGATFVGIYGLLELTDTQASIGQIAALSTIPTVLRVNGSWPSDDRDPS